MNTKMLTQLIREWSALVDEDTKLFLKFDEAEGTEREFLKKSVLPYSLQNAEEARQRMNDELQRLLKDENEKKEHTNIFDAEK